MLSFQAFFDACAGFWITERTYHSPLENEVERSHTEFQATSLDCETKYRLVSSYMPSSGSFAGLKINVPPATDLDQAMPGFAVSFDTLSEKGERVAMSLKAMFIPDSYVAGTEAIALPPLPIAAHVPTDDEVIQGFYLRDEGYSEAGSIAGRFTYQPTRQTLEMITYYNRSVALDQMRFIAPDIRLRTIITYQRPSAGEVPSLITLVGFGVEKKQNP